VDLGYGRIADRFDAKFHRSLVKHPDGCLYAAPALLHCSDKYIEAPGAAIVKFDPITGQLEKRGIVLPHVYIQALALDPERELLYCLCFAPEYLASFNLRTGEVRNFGLIGSGCCGLAQGENLVLDNDGGVWCNWSLTRAWQSEAGPDAMRLCRYDPREGRIRFFQKGLPQPDGDYGFAKAEAFFNFGDGWIYASGANGSLYRIDPTSGNATWLFTPTPDRPSRLSSLVKTGDGIAYGITGRYGQCELMRVDYKTGTFAKLGPIVDPEGAAMHQCHDIVAAADGTLYACENDNPCRSSYLWEIRPEA
jgi:streptogramin lyase